MKEVCPTQRPSLGFVFAAGIERAPAEELRSLTPTPLPPLVLSHKVKTKLEDQVGIEGRTGIGRFVLDELAKASPLGFTLI